MNNEISVLMSIYKAENPLYFDMAMKSVWDEQIYRPMQIVLVKDGPLTEKLDMIIDFWKEKIKNKFIVISLEQNKGLAHALNVGIRHCAGDYIARMDTDDICYPERFKLQLDFLKSNPDIYVLGSGIQEIDENGNLTYIRNYPESMSGIINYIAKSNPLAHPTVMIRRYLFDSGISYNEKYRKNQDLDLWFTVLKTGYQIGNIKQPLLYFRRTKATYRKRRIISYSWLELCIYMRGINNLHGLFTWRYVYPMARFILKLCPPSFLEFMYTRFFPKKYNIEQ